MTMDLLLEGVRHVDADDTQVYCSTDLLNPQDDLKRITACVSDIHTWMIQNKLKINDDKTKFLILHSSYKEFTANLNFEIGQTLVKPSDTCRNLGVIFDSHMKMENQIQSICRSVNFHLRSINSVRDSLTDEATVLLSPCPNNIKAGLLQLPSAWVTRQAYQSSSAPSEYCC